MAESASRVRTLIVDDEEPARRRLRSLLHPFPDVEVVGEAGDGEEALQKIAELRPDLVFLDIQMPGCSGLDVAISMAEPAPAVVFCTAFDRYAVEAFELQALDYLLKPVSRARLAKALERIRHRGGTGGGGVERVRRAFPERPARFLGRRGSRLRVIPESAVLYFRTEDGMTRLRSRQGAYWVQPALGELERRLGPDDYFRVSRSALVRLASVREVVPMPGGLGEVVMEDGTRLEVSRRRFRELLERIEGR